MIFLHFTLRRLRGRLAAAAIVLVVATAVAWAHSGPGMDHMQMDVVTVCLAIEGTALAALAGIAGRRLDRPYGSRVIELPLGGQRHRAVPLVRARDGPAMLQVFRI